MNNFGKMIILSLIHIVILTLVLLSIRDTRKEIELQTFNQTEKICNTIDKNANKFSTMITKLKDFEEMTFVIRRESGKFYISIHKKENHGKTK